ncbi:serine protease inhibitor 27A-like [Sitophilus oryzae]|uniref:Serine protease inhibitor 27A-like n=1 Tax=Sitophilus oryzae TaxID=7048 RepID=A0A6J2XXE0_SITOR|nr:serine protease inhibitor 27A-like [Sitophilus oryzae]
MFLLFGGSPYLRCTNRTLTNWILHSSLIAGLSKSHKNNELVLVRIVYRMLLYFVLGFLLNSVLCQNVTNETNVNVDDIDDFYPNIQWSDAFDWKLLKTLSNESSNVLISPLSLRLVLAILYEGSSGATQREFESVLRFTQKDTLREEFKSSLDALQNSTDGENVLKICTSLFLDSSVEAKEKYAETIKQYYYTDLVPSNFSDPESASSQINAWVEEATLGLVSHLTQPEDLDAMTLLLANAVYFKGIWRYKFPKENTKVDKFYVSPEQAIYIPFMTITEQFFYYESSVLDAKILRLPYKSSNISMFIVLPLSKGGLPELIRKINLVDLHRELFQMNKKLIQVSIPKFQFKFKASYYNLLKDYGFRTMFQNTASFTQIVKGHSSILRKLVVSDILQTTGIQVDEEGSIAYAATDVIVGNKIGVPDSTFNASHPFLFFLQEDKEGTVFFVGKIENPLQQELEIRRNKSDEQEI